MTLRLLSDWSPAFGFTLATFLALLAWQLCWREVRIADSGKLRFLLPTLRALAIFLITLTFMEPVFESRIREGDPGKVLFAIDSSRSMTLHDNHSGSTSDSTRFARAAGALADERTGLLSQLSDAFDMTVKRLDDKSGSMTLWDSNLRSDQPKLDVTHWKPSDWAESSALGDAVLAVADSLSAAGGTSRSAVLVLMSDGQSNAGQSPLAVAEKLNAQGIPVFTVGFGSTEQREDLAIRSANAPERIFLNDTFSGTITVAELVPTGKSYSAEVSYEGVVLWSSDLVSQNESSREIDFAFPVRKLLEVAENNTHRDAQFTTLPVKLDLRVQMEHETFVDNNKSSLYMSVAVQQAKILLIDGRSRWEMRYLKNMFSRDPSWEITSEIASATQGTSSVFPTTREQLFRFNLVILGDVRSRHFKPEQLRWLREFVEVGAGGLILIDGARGHLQDRGYTMLQDLLPIEWTPSHSSIRSKLPKHASVTSAGAQLDALQIEPTSSDNAAAWAELPPVQFVSQVEAMLGSEVLVEAANELDRMPMVVFRRFGAGRVLFVATDETWRWRYKVADRIHTRLWNQLARWIMRTPLSLRGEFVSLDSGRAHYDVGQSIEFRCQLRDAEGGASTGKSAIAIVKRGSRTVARLPLFENNDVPGDYRADTSSLLAGDYSVRVEAAGFPQSALDLQSKFSVLAPQGIELQETTCNEDLLKKIAQMSGGKYVHEDQIGLLADLLRPVSGGRYSQSITILWQTYWWFVPALSLLIAEWLLRKRAGLP